MLGQARVGARIEARIGAAEMPRQGAGAQIARRAEFQANRPFRERRHELRIGRRGDAMADALGAENLHGIADRIRAADLSGMNQPMQAVGGRVFINVAKLGRGKSEFVAAHSKGDHARAAQVHSASRNLAGRSRPKLAHRVEYPLKAQPAMLERRGGFADCGEVGGDILFAQEHDADGESDLGINNILGQQLFAHAASHQGVVRRGAQIRSDPLVGLDEGG